MSQQIKKLTNGKIQVKTDGSISVSLQCNVSYRITSKTRLDLEDSAGQKYSLFSDQVTTTQLDPAAPVTQSFADAQEMADFLDANFFVG